MIRELNSGLSSTGSKLGKLHCHLIYVPDQDTHQSASFYPSVLMGTAEFNAWGNTNHVILQWTSIPPYRNQDKLRSDGPHGLYAAFPISLTIQ